VGQIKGDSDLPILKLAEAEAQTAAGTAAAEPQWQPWWVKQARNAE